MQKESILGQVRTASAKVLRSELSWCGLRKRKWTSVANREDERTNTRGRGSEIKETKEPDLETTLRSSDFILSER